MTVQPPSGPTKSGLVAILNRFSEPSSYAGLAGIAAVAGVNLPSGLWQSVTFVLAGICGIVAFIMKEKGVGQ